MSAWLARAVCLRLLPWYYSGVRGCYSFISVSLLQSADVSPHLTGPNVTPSTSLSREGYMKGHLQVFLRGVTDRTLTVVLPAMKANITHLTITGEQWQHHGLIKCVRTCCRGDT